MKQVLRITCVMLGAFVLMLCFSEAQATGKYPSVIICDIPKYGQRDDYGVDCGMACITMVEAYYKGYQDDGSKNNALYMQVIDESYNSYLNLKQDPIAGITGGNYNKAYTYTEVKNGLTEADLQKIYDNLVEGKPVLLHRYEDKTQYMHWVVVYKYDGPTDKLDANGFWVMSPRLPAQGAAVGGVVYQNYKTFIEMEVPGSYINHIIYYVGGIKSIPINKSNYRLTVTSDEYNDGYIQMTTGARLLPGSRFVGRYSAGEILSIDAGSGDELAFERWTCDRPDGKFANATNGATTFTMPASDTTVTAHFASTALEQSPTVSGLTTTSAQLNNTVTLNKDPSAAAFPAMQSVTCFIGTDKSAVNSANSSSHPNIYMCSSSNPQPVESTPTAQKYEFSFPTANFTNGSERPPLRQGTTWYYKWEITAEGKTYSSGSVKAFQVTGWYDLAANKTTSPEFPNIKGTDTDALMEGYVKYDLGSKLIQGGCFLSTSQADVSNATPDNHSNVLYVADPASTFAQSGNGYSDTSDYRYTRLYYTAQGSQNGSLGFETALQPGTTYYYKFYSIRPIDGNLGNLEVVYSDVRSFTTTGATATKYQLTVTASEGGTVNAASGTYAANASIALVATPSAGYVFNGWTSSNGGAFANAASASTTFTMPGNATTVTASFSREVSNIHSFRVVAGTGGTVDESINGNYATGSKINISATPLPNYVFTGWSCVGGTVADMDSATTVFTMGTTDAIAMATFTYMPETLYTLTLSASEGGTVNTSVAGQYAAGAKIDLVATPKQDYVFVSWDSNGGSFTDPYSEAATFTMPASNANVHAEFAYYPSNYALEASPAVLDFGTLQVGYGAQPGKTVTVKNTGNLTVTLNTAASPANFTFSNFSKTTLAPNESATLTVTPRTGLAEGTYNILVYINSDVQAAAAPLSLKLKVAKSAVAPSISTTSLYDGTVNTPYVQTLSASGDTPIVWSLASGSLPAGLQLSSTGIISGTPTSPGTTSFTVKASNTIPPDATRQFSITINPAPAYSIAVAPSALSFGTVNTGYAQPAAQTVTITNTGNQSVTLNQSNAVNYAVSALSSAALASGASATFTVQPKAGLGAGSYMENIEVSAQEGGVAKQTVDVFFAVQSPVYSLAVEPASLDFGTLYTGYGAPAGKQITIRNTGTVGVTLNSGVSLANFTVDRFSKTTLAAGETAIAIVTPKVGLTSGNYDTTVDISTLDNSAKATLSLKLMVADIPTAPVITTTKPADGTVGMAYRQELAATGDATIVWSIAAGKLPDGLSLSADGVISGTPTAAGISAFTVKASNGVNPDATKELSITIKAAPVIPTAVPIEIKPNAVITQNKAGIVNLVVGEGLPDLTVGNFKELRVDNKVVPAGADTFAVRNGSVIVQLNPAYLNTLSLGKHNFTVALQGGVYNGMEQTAVITVVGSDAAVLPKTGDRTPILRYVALLLLSLAAGITVVKRKNKSSDVR